MKGSDGYNSGLRAYDNKVQLMLEKNLQISLVSVADKTEAVERLSRDLNQQRESNEHAIVNLAFG